MKPIAVNHFLDLGRCGEVGLFYDNFQKKITEAWSMQYEESSFKINLPSGIEKVCFANLSGNILNQADYEKIKNYDVYDANLFLIPIEKTCDMPYKLIKHINITKITKSENPYCIENSKEMKIKKGFYDKLVFVERNV